MAREPVKVNVYDMTSLNNYISSLGIGVYHCGLQIYDREYAYGGHSYSFSGVFEIAPKDEIALGEENFKFKETITIGHTDFNHEEVREIINNLGNEFTGDRYHLLNKNCNHFTDSLAKVLCGKGIPTWVNRLATMLVNVPLLERFFLPRELLTPIVIQEDICKEMIESEESNSRLNDDVKDESTNIIRLFKKY